MSCDQADLRRSLPRSLVHSLWTVISLNRPEGNGKWGLELTRLTAKSSYLYKHRPQAVFITSPWNEKVGELSRSWKQTDAGNCDKSEGFLLRQILASRTFSRKSSICQYLTWKINCRLDSLWRPSWWRRSPRLAALTSSESRRSGLLSARAALGVSNFGGLRWVHLLTIYAKVWATQQVLSVLSRAPLGNNSNFDGDSFIISSSALGPQDESLWRGRINGYVRSAQQLTSNDRITCCHSYCAGSDSLNFSPPANDVLRARELTEKSTKCSKELCKVDLWQLGVLNTLLRADLVGQAGTHWFDLGNLDDVGLAAKGWLLYALMLLYASDKVPAGSCKLFNADSETDWPVMGQKRQWR